MVEIEKKVMKIRIGNEGFADEQGLGFLGCFFVGVKRRELNGEIESK